MKYRNFGRVTLMYESQIKKLLGEDIVRSLKYAEDQNIYQLKKNLKEFGMIEGFENEEIDEEAMESVVVLLNEEAETGFPLIVVIKPWVSRDYTGYRFTAQDGRKIEEFAFQQDLDAEQAYEYADQFSGLNSVEEVCEKAKQLKKQGIIVS